MPAKESNQSPKKNSKVSLQTAFEQLTPKQQVFVKEYIVDFNATRAALETGAKHGSAQVIGCKMLANPKVGKAIAESLRPMMQEAEMTAEKLVKQLHNFLFYDITPYISQDGSLKVDPKDLPESIRQSIVAIEGDEKFSRDGELLSSRTRIRLVNKDSALKLAMQYLRMLEPDTQVLKQDFFTIFYQQAEQGVQSGVSPTIVNGNGKVISQEVIGNGKPKIY